MDNDIATISEALLGDWVSIAPRDPAEQKSGRLALALLSQARVQIFAVRPLRTRGRQLGRPVRRRAAGANQDRRAHAMAGRASDRSRRAEGRFPRRRGLLGHAAGAGLADVLNKVAASGYAPWAINTAQSIFGKSFLPFGLKEGTNFMEYDPVYLRATCCSGALATSTVAASIPSRTVRPICRSRWSGSSANSSGASSGVQHARHGSRPALPAVALERRAAAEPELLHDVVFALGERHGVVEPQRPERQAQIRPTPTEVRTTLLSSYCSPQFGHFAVLTSPVAAHDVGPW